MKNTGISRRRFAQLLGGGAAFAATRPAWSSAAEKPQASPISFSPEAGVVRLSSNENPYGPSQQALKAMNNAFGIACRYPDDHANSLVEAVARLNGVTHDQILLGDGSGEILKLAAETFTGSGGTAQADVSAAGNRGALVAADPTFEAILNHARTNGAEVVKVPLTARFSHDLAKMKAAARQGLVYVCNPNNPTASITPRSELREFIASCPPETMILVDEAYYHYADSPDYETVIPLVKDHPNLIVARTFSKIYGMAGLRCGYCISQPRNIERLRSNQPWDSVNIMAIAAAAASLNDPTQVENGRRLNADARKFVINELEGMGYTLIPSEANFIMIDMGRPVSPLIQQFKEKNVQVGRLFPALPNHMRVTIGKKSEMETYLAALKQISRPA